MNARRTTIIVTAVLASTVSLTVAAGAAYTPSAPTPRADGQRLYHAAPWRPLVNTGTPSTTGTTQPPPSTDGTVLENTTGTGTTAPSAPRPVPLSAVDAFELKIFELVNIERANAGLGPLKLASCADRVADEWAIRIAASATLFHQSLSNIQNACATGAVGENIALTTTTAQDMVASWMASPGHRQNILNTSWNYTGIGVKFSGGKYWAVQDFIAI